MSVVPARLRRHVITRAAGRCEYCRLAQEGQEASFHVDHVEPYSVGGPTEAKNLALACVSCSLRKEARRKAVDPRTGKTTSLFHPRRQAWHDHFRVAGVKIVGRTAAGRATVQALRMNRLVVLAIRREEIERGRFP